MDEQSIIKPDTFKNPDTFILSSQDGLNYEGSIILTVNGVRQSIKLSGYAKNTQTERVILGYANHKS
jgi:hypothetical protein